MVNHAQWKWEIGSSSLAGGGGPPAGEDGFPLCEARHIVSYSNLQFNRRNFKLNYSVIFTIHIKVLSYNVEKFVPFD